ncbi:CTP synthase family protein [Pelomyxa schiedti]|nr:CTP synthase family protein [Pelomyxa schiedti]
MSASATSCTTNAAAAAATGSGADSGNATPPVVKYILVTGGVLSGLGKGIIASSTGLIMKQSGLRITSIKIDPYVNVDAGTMSPFEHGEVFVLEDGGECDLDLGNYERFLNIRLTSDNNITTGKIYKYVIEKERRGDYLGHTVQIIPHVCNAIQSWVERVSHVPVDDSGKPPEVCIIELGGTVGDIESMPFIEAMRQFQFRVGEGNFCCIHVSLVPVMGSMGELKSKPTQSSVRELRCLGLYPELIMCRCAKPITNELKEKISLFCHLPPRNVIDVHDVHNTLEVPLLLESQLSAQPNADMTAWHTLVDKCNLLQTANHVKIAIVGKYTGLQDTYLSVIKSLEHSALHAGFKLEILWVKSSALDECPNQDNEMWMRLKEANGILVPGGFGGRGIEGKLKAISFSRQHHIPFLGICFGMQLAVVEYARSVANLAGANSTEIAPMTPHPVVVYMPEVSKTMMGGTMRLGIRTTVFQNPSCLAARLYKATSVRERHRHRYEVNTEYVPQLEALGLRFVGRDLETSTRMEVIELDTSLHPFFLGTQFHPEFQSHIDVPSPVFMGFMKASCKLPIE